VTLQESIVRYLGSESLPGLTLTEMTLSSILEMFAGTIKFLLKTILATPFYEMDLIFAIKLVLILTLFLSKVLFVALFMPTTIYGPGGKGSMVILKV